MLFIIGKALNEPFGFDIPDINLNILCAQTTKDIVDEFVDTILHPAELIDKDHETPNWLENIKPASENASSSDESNNSPFSFFKPVLRYLKIRQIRMAGLPSLVIFLVWSSFIVFYTWSITRNDARPDGVRWWYVYIPISAETTGYVSLCVFLLLGFWITDAYSRYWRGLLIWQTDIQPGIAEVAFQFALVHEKDTWHHRDLERIFSYLTALPYVAKGRLRQSTELSDLNGILSEKDIKAIIAAPDPFTHVCTVLYGYINAADGVCNVDDSPNFMSVHLLNKGIRSIEMAVLTCKSMVLFPVSPSFTVHLKLFTLFWLALYPLTVVQYEGFMMFIYLVPISYMIINLLVIGKELSNPFGEDPEDIPMDMFCDEIRDRLHTMYNQSRDAKTLVRQSDYKTESFIPKRKKDYKDNASASPEKSRLSVRSIPSSLIKITRYFPSVSIKCQVAITVWTIFAVLLSWGLSRVWDDDRNDGDIRNGWNSPIDVNVSVLTNVGFALFMILTFQASDSIGRYEKGAELLFDVEMQLRCLAVETVQQFPTNVFHPQDKERILAHIVQIPLCLRDKLLNINRDESEKDGLLSDEDHQRFGKIATPLEYLLRTIEAYYLMQDSKAIQPLMDTPCRLPRALSTLAIQRLSVIRRTISRALGVKRFPVVAIYSRHQHMFSILWLVILPLSLTAKTGFLTIILAPIIAYGVFALEEVAAKLVDPYGSDFIDIPVDELCTNASNSVLEAVSTIGWNCKKYTKRSATDTPSRIGIILNGTVVHDTNSLNSISNGNESIDVTEQDNCIQVRVPRESKTGTKTNFAHILYSVPWGWIFRVTVWTSLACAISYLFRMRNYDQSYRWWKSHISIDSSVGTYLSIITFTLLGFYVSAALTRFHTAALVWGKLGSSCHSLTRAFLSLTPTGTIHEGDHERILGFISAIPHVVTAQLLDSKEIPEISRVLSDEDIGQIECSESKAVHCVDVLRSYMLRILCHQNTYRDHDWPFPDSSASILRDAMTDLERAIHSLLYLKTFEIAPGFISLLNALLGLWFFIIPFIFAEFSGWLTIIWMTLIAFGLFGVYAVAKEIQAPFGTDLNDLALNTLSDGIVRDVLFVSRVHMNGWQSLIVARPVPEVWKKEPKVQDNEPLKHRHIFAAREDLTRIQKLKQLFNLAKKSVRWLTLLCVSLWSILITGLSFLFSRISPLPSGESCNLWFCSRIAVDSHMVEYVGFGVFLLLGNRLYDSHCRYVRGLKLWQEDITGIIRTAANRIFESYDSKTFHEGDLERIAGHLAAYPICLMGSLRDMEYKEKLLEILSEDDVNDILASVERANHCKDVLWSYIIETEYLRGQRDVKSTPGCIEHWAVGSYLQKLDDAMLECEQMAKIPVPFGYIQHLRIFLGVWLLLLPFGIVETSGWLTTIVVVFATYLVAGVETWAEELSNPFGFDISDIPLEELTDSIISVVKGNLNIFRNGLKSLIITDRHTIHSTELPIS